MLAIIDLSLVGFNVFFLDKFIELKGSLKCRIYFNPALYQPLEVKRRDSKQEHIPAIPILIQFFKKMRRADSPIRRRRDTIIFQLVNKFNPVKHKEFFQFLLIDFVEPIFLNTHSPHNILHNCSVVGRINRVEIDSIMGNKDIIVSLISHG
jgi:hypothetical protein